MCFGAWLPDWHPVFLGPHSDPVSVLSGFTLLSKYGHFWLQITKMATAVVPNRKTNISWVDGIIQITIYWRERVSIHWLEVIRCGRKQQKKYSNATSSQITSVYVRQASKRRDISFRVNRMTARLTGTERQRCVKDAVAPPSRPLTHRVVSSSVWAKQWLTRRLCLAFPLQPATPQLPLKHVDTPVSHSFFFCSRWWPNVYGHPFTCMFVHF